jgi:hypothetical protein
MKTQECKESVNNGIGKEMSWRKVESDNIDGQTVYFGQSFCRFVERLNCLPM